MARNTTNQNSGGMQNTNTGSNKSQGGNFKEDREKASRAGKKGGQNSHQNSM